ncbi:hypothetical protein [Nocardia lijiangensis]|uniref:hypothetical protein n=1 Tax=Nocardia lijiangensis TaxID=299618 RepID=UPI0012DD0AFB|nr:hypothetical protein [Nocardia lijiangensis]
MSKLLAGVVLAAASVGVGVATAAPASAERGETGCFTYSYDKGWSTTTVYYHNRCGAMRKLAIYHPDCDKDVVYVDAESKGNYVASCEDITYVIEE